MKMGNLKNDNGEKELGRFHSLRFRQIYDARRICFSLFHFTLARRTEKLSVRILHRDSNHVFANLIKGREAQSSFDNLLR